MIDVKYSVDMIRLKVKVPHIYFEHYNKMYLSLDPRVNYYEKFSFKDYRHNWHIQEQSPFGEEYSYWLGYKHNSEGVNTSSYLVIEFNPNKCSMYGLLDSILKTFYKFDFVTVISLDIAMDFEVNINKLIIDKYRKQVYKLYDNGGDDKTHYLGKGDGRIKIYNKAREMGISGDLTRYEITKKIDLSIADVCKDDYSFDCEVLPIGYMNDVPVSDKTLCSLYWSVLNGYPIDNLSRVYKDKIRAIIDSNTEIKFDKEKISQTIRQWFQGYSEIYILP